jgi:hypothetical protein
MWGTTVLSWDYAGKNYSCQLRRPASKKKNVTESEQEGVVGSERSD